MNTLPSLSSLRASLIQERLERYASDLAVLLAKASRLGWESEASEVTEEILRAQKQKTPTVRFPMFTDLGRLQVGFLRDIRLVEGAACIVEPLPNGVWTRFKNWLVGGARTETPTQTGLTPVCLSQGSVTMC